MTPVRHRPRRAARWAAVALVCLLGQLLGVLHMGLIEHRRCAAHGELVEGGAGGVGEAVEVAAPLGVATALPHEQRAEHDHDHCQAPSERCAPQPAAIEAGPVELMLAGGAAPVARSPVAIVGLFRLAPKASPPTAG
ncbi:MAG: hypothetical protein IPH44_06620 [Myxococcales bacterium]|nr:hypothetical protein [Myxococcales bacterium]MBK7194442.1 hypothetical protein [Myxococcales bacterium]MBP6843753.1 hypothetical protein [Kofleriaceae bacterium]